MSIKQHCLIGIAILPGICVNALAPESVTPARSMSVASQPARGPLRVHPVNPRYFTDGTKLPDDSLKADFLTGSHTWNNLVDMGRDDPPAWDARKVSLLDTDHVWGIGGNPAWVCKSFLRGHNPIFMDPYDHKVLSRGPTNQWEGVWAMGQTRRLAARVNLAAMTPHEELASTKYCLANPGVAYIVYLPQGGAVTVDLTAASGTLAAEWLSPVARDVTPGGTFGGGGKREFKAPFTTNRDAVLHVWSDRCTQTQTRGRS